MAVNFLKRVQNTPKVKAIKKKIAKNERDRKALSRTYKSSIKSESKRLGKKTRKPKKKRKAHRH